MKKRRGIFIVCLLVLGCCFCAGIMATQKALEKKEIVEEEIFANVSEEYEVSEEAPEASKIETEQEKPVEILPEEVTPMEAAPVEPVLVEILGETHLSDETELYFNDRRVDDLAAFTEALSQFTNLQKVEMCHTNLCDEEMAGLREAFPDTKFVWVIKVAGFELRTDAVAFSTMFTGYGWGPETSKDFEALKYCTDMEALDIGHHSITDLSFMEHMTNLKILILAINKLEDISVLENMTQLTYLELFLNKITDLSPLEKLVHLEHLNLCHNKALGEIEPILHYPNLQRLWISYCNLTSDEIARIREAYPDTRLEFDVYESVEAGWRSTEVYTRMRNVFNTNTMDEMFLPKVTTQERSEEE